LEQSAVQRFYRYHSYVYDATRWMILHGRRRAVNLLELRPDSQVLEIGCGTGLNFPYMVDELDPASGRLVGLDFSHDMLARASRRVAARRWEHVELVQGDATQLDLGRQFDAILFAYSLTMIPDWPAALERAYAHLKPGGRLVVLDFGRFGQWGPLRPVMRTWLRLNHVDTQPPYAERLRSLCADVMTYEWAGGYNFTAVARRPGAPAERGTGVRVLTMPTPHHRDFMERMVFRGIVFNMSWEDPEMDRRAFRITPDDTVVSISSAGCNPLNFLCQSPRRLLTVDGNPAQNAIVELKLAAIAELDHETFFDIFAARRPGVVTRHYRPRLRPHLSPSAREFWDRNLWMAHRGLYDFGKMGLAIRLVRFILPQLGISRQRIEEFLELRDLDEQRAFYERYVAPRLWGPAVEHLCRSRWFMYLCGVHPRQFDLVHQRHGIYEYVRERIEYALTRVPIYDNYFLSIATTGRFRGYRVPPYLMPENFATLRRNLDRVTVVNGWLGPYLDTLPPQSITKFNLLDIFDWMEPHAFEATLKSVLRVAAPGATLIYRSGSYRLDPPDSIRPHLVHHADLSRELLAIDRSATYGSFYVFSVKDGSNGRDYSDTAAALVTS
jgi:S-adenosylmethionine-diacylglycerol 3-amino-3-carboxypropyl transferase